MTTQQQRETAIAAITTAMRAADESSESVSKSRAAVYAELEAELLAGGSWPSDAGARVLAAEQSAQEAVADRIARLDVRHRLRRAGA